MLFSCFDFCWGCLVESGLDGFDVDCIIGCGGFCVGDFVLDVVDVFEGGYV